MNQFFKSFLTNAEQETAEVLEGIGTLLKGCINLYQVTNEMFYKDYILKYTEKLIDSEGKIKGYENGNFTLEHMNLGGTLIWAYGQTKEEKYKLAIDALKKEVPKFKVEWKNTIQCGCMEDDMKKFCSVQPFYMEYETKFENKECYEEIITQFRDARKYLFNSNEAQIHFRNDGAKPENIAIYGEDSSACETVAQYLLALIETMDKTSIEIFEHYRLLEQYFKEVIKVCPELLHIEGNEKISIIVAYAVMKACNEKVLLAEKYYGFAEVLLNNILIYFHNGETKDELWSNLRMVGILMMTYSQYMVANKTKKIKELGCCYEQ